MAARKCPATSLRADGSPRTPDCVAAVRTQPYARTQHYTDSAARRSRVLNVTTSIAAVVSGTFGIVWILTVPGGWRTGLINSVTAAVFVLIPFLRRFGELVAPLTFFCTAYLSIFLVCWDVGTDSGLQFYFLVAACLVVLQLGIERIALAGLVAGVGAGLVIVLEFCVPRNTGVQPPWAQSMAFVATTVSACVMVVVTVWFALREIARAEAVMEREYERSEALLANILPVSIAQRLKEPAHNVIADKYGDASVLFADIAGFTERASDLAPDALIRFLDRLYGEFDALVDKHRLEKIKVSGDSYMVVSGVPEPRPDHLQALADFALDMAAAAATLKDPHGAPVPLRIGLACGPVVAGVVGSRRFFYDVWGDAVNVASRMETTDAVGRIQVPDGVYQRLKDDFVLQERGIVNVKGKGVMRTWYLISRKPEAGPAGLRAERPQPAGV